MCLYVIQENNYLITKIGKYSPKVAENKMFCCIVFFCIISRYEKKIYSLNKNNS